MTKPPDLRPWFVEADASQERASAAFQRSDVLFLLGQAGSGKTHCAIGLALTSLALKQARSVMLSRPTVPCGDDLGYMPGDAGEKMAPWMGAIKDVLRNMTWLKFEDIPFDVTPLQHIRGRTVQDAVLIVDEAQNATYPQLVAALGRLGRGGKIVFAGDVAQSDLGSSPLGEVAERLRGLARVETVTLRGQHRNPLVTQMMERLEVRQ